MLLSKIELIGKLEEVLVNFVQVNTLLQLNLNSHKGP